MWNKIKKKLFLIIFKTHVSESGINGFVPGRMIIAFEEFKNGIDVVFFIQELYMKFGDFIFILFFKMKVFISEFFDKFFDFFADFFLVTPCHCNHFVQFLSNGLWLFSGSLLMVCTIWNFSTTQWGYCGWFAQCFTVSAEGLTFESKMILNVVSSLWVGISRKYLCLISISLL